MGVCIYVYIYVYTHTHIGGPLGGDEKRAHTHTDTHMHTHSLSCTHIYSDIYRRGSNAAGVMHKQINLTKI